MLIRRLACVLILLAGFAACDAARAREWTRFRGPNGQGVALDPGAAATIPVTWTEDEVNWKTALPGVGHGSPVVWDDRLFLLSGDPTSAERYVLCLGAGDGKIRWKRTFASAAHHLHMRNSYGSGTPAVDAERLYVAWSAPEKTTLLALSHDGRTEWELDLGPFVSQHGFGTSPVLYDGTVIVTMLQQGERLEGKESGISFVVAVDCRTGEIRWKTPRKSVYVAYSTPAIYEPGDGPAQLVCCSTAHGTYSLDPATGRENWSIDVFRMRTVSSPVIAGDLILGTCGSGGGGNYMVAVRPPSGTRPVEEAFRVTSQVPYVPTSVVAGKLMFLWYDRGIASCVRTDDGSVVWRERLGGGFSGSPVRVGDRIYCINDEGEVIVIAAADKFKLLGKTPLGEPSRATPAIAGGRMYLRTYSSLISVGGR